jgi:PST family polysaccharide transporter
MPILKLRWQRLLPAQLQARLEGRLDLIAVIRNSVWLITDRLIRMALGLLVGAWVARYLGPTQYGELAYVIAFVSFFQAVACLGADGIIVRDIARNPDSAGEILGTGFSMRLAAGIICWFLAVSFIIFVNGPHDQSVKLTAITGSILVFQAVDTIDLWFQSQSQSRRTVLAKLVGYTISSTSKIFLILQKAPLIAFAAVTALDVIIAAISLTYAYKQFQTIKPWKSVGSRAAKLFYESYPYLLSGLSIMVYMRIDLIMIKNMLGTHELGIFAAALPISSVWNFIPMTLIVSLGPMIARKRIESPEAYYRSLAKIFRLFAGIGLLISIFVAFSAKPIIGILYGGGYSQAAGVLRIHIFTNIFINLGVAQSLWSINEGKGYISMYQTIVGAVISIVGNLILIPRFGIIGAAWVALLAQTGSAVVSNIVVAPQIFKLQLMGLLQRPQPKGKESV